MAGSDQAETQLATFHGGNGGGGGDGGDERREALKRSFNSPPESDPWRILIATDAARKGVNLQKHCRRLVHVDVPWEPGRMEQRNDRIDLTLQHSPQMNCHDFMLPQRPKDTLLDKVMRKTDQNRSELDCLQPVLIRKRNDLLAKGISPRPWSPARRRSRGSSRRRPSAPRERCWRRSWRAAANTRRNRKLRWHSCMAWLQCSGLTTAQARATSTDIDLLVGFLPIQPMKPADAYFGVVQQFNENLGLTVDLWMVDAMRNPIVRADIEALNS